MQVKVKKLDPKAVIPSYAKPGDAGLDLTAISIKMDEHGCACYGTGLAFEIPEGYVGLIFPRSSVAKKNQILTNCVGVVDSGYRGEVTFKFRPTEIYLDNFINVDQVHKVKDGRPEIVGDTMYGIGERVGQLIILPYPQIELIESEELSETERGNGAYGSSGK
jgi:dUTP pyrophosphatase